MLTTSKNIAVHSLADLVNLRVKSLLRRQHLNRDVITALVGDRGSGKTTSGARHIFQDHMVQGEPCWSNIQIKIVVTVSNEEAALYNLEGGEVVYESKPLTKGALLALSDEYRGGIIYVDEINIYSADARRFMSNTNLEMNDVGQELRKLQSALTYTVINEMFVDMRIRDLTDTFIRCEDTALTLEGLQAKRTPGLEVEWSLYPISRKLCGLRYNRELTRPIGPIAIPNRAIWGAIDTYKKQERKYYKVKGKIGGMDVTTEITPDPVVEKELSEWGWLAPIASKLWRDERWWVPASEVYALPEVQQRGITQGLLSNKLDKIYRIKNERFCKDKKRFTAYVMPEKMSGASATASEGLDILNKSQGESSETI